AALMPPLATVGLGLTMGSGSIAGGALALFLTNLIAISAAGVSSSVKFRLKLLQTLADLMGSSFQQSV
ncbi:MAG: DUF389 domain-containing protein, partial [Cyanobacteriota bacterium]|nr:DUF389 domain-containing protein [Cyanobacteriota bacterium]